METLIKSSKGDAIVIGEAAEDGRDVLEPEKSLVPGIAARFVRQEVCDRVVGGRAKSASDGAVNCSASRLDSIEDMGGMLLVARAAQQGYHARFLCRAAFIPCIGASGENKAAELSQAFRRGDARLVQSLRRGTAPDKSCWFAGDGWWLPRVPAG